MGKEARIPRGLGASPRDGFAVAAPDGSDQTILRAARSSCTLMLTGETGVGKGHLAKWMHETSPRGPHPFIPVNCGAIPESIIDSQLFGHVQGAFSGATSDHVGLVRAAERGTLFLDEVSELPGSAQTRLLRLLQDREVQPVGRARPVVVDVRIMAATNGDLRDAVIGGRFREDLLFRLDVVRIHVRPLRERPEELAALLEQFNREFSELYQQAPLEFEDAAIEQLRRFAWPGNIRQLRTVVERLHVLCPEEPVSRDRLIDVGLDHALAPQPSRSGRVCLDHLRHEELLRVMSENGGSVARTAAVFGVHRSTIYRWLQDHGKTATGRKAR